jgi:2'-hydroxyisoflavone reductase
VGALGARDRGANAGHWTFVSSISVYADSSAPGHDVGDSLVDPRTGETITDDEERRGVDKRSPRAIQAAHPDRRRARPRRLDRAVREEHLVGTFDSSGPRSTPGAVLDEVADAVGAADLERVPATPEALTAAGVQPWSRSLPLWLPASHAGMLARDTAPAAAAGLHCRPIADTARAALARERALGADRPRRAGLTPAEGSEILGRLGRTR